MGASRSPPSRSSDGRQRATKFKSFHQAENRTRSRGDTARGDPTKGAAIMAAIKLQAQPSAANDGRPDEATPDPFDLAKLRLDQSFVEAAGVKKLLTTV